ncbi:MAG TPA: hypothetical protein EYG86_10000 [Crocinitomicaceae bacterium]|nr:hypothetical protein [Crocinitomicaceae bacterium]
MPTLSAQRIQKETELIQVLLLGDQAGKKGDLEESLNWYLKGLSIAKEIKDELMTIKFSSLVMMSL